MSFAHAQDDPIVGKIKQFNNQLLYYLDDEVFFYYSPSIRKIWKVNQRSRKESTYACKILERKRSNTCDLKRFI
jgi:hypothetical protein